MHFGLYIFLASIGSAVNQSRPSVLYTSLTFIRLILPMWNPKIWQMCGFSSQRVRVRVRIPAEFCLTSHLDALHITTNYDRHQQNLINARYFDVKKLPEISGDRSGLFCTPRFNRKLQRTLAKVCSAIFGQSWCMHEPGCTSDDTHILLQEGSLWRG